MIRATRPAIVAMLLAAMVSLLAGPASASTTATAFLVPLTADKRVLPNDNSDTEVLRTTLALVAGESRRVSDRLGATLSSSHGAEVGNRIACLGPDGTTVVAETASGANHRGSSAGEIGLIESLLLKAPTTGTYTCSILARTSADNQTDYVMHAVISAQPLGTTGTWLRISSADEVNSHAWDNHECDSPGNWTSCVYLGGVFDPSKADVFTDRENWTASTNTAAVDVVGTFQITSCYYGTSSCTAKHWGLLASSARFKSFLEFNQLNPDGSICQINQSSDDTSPSTDTGPDAQHVYQLPNSVHHLPINYHLTAPVSPNCNGSRRFVLDLHVEWLAGNPIKLDNGGFNVIQSVRSSLTTAVPPVVGMTEAQAVSALKAHTFTPVVADRVMNAAPVGTVFAQNSPAGTIEPTGSAVDLRVSLGQSTVPNVVGFDEASAIRMINAAGLAIGQISSISSCLDPGLVQVQNPHGSSFVLPGSSVSITLATCPQGGGGNPPQPK